MTASAWLAENFRTEFRLPEVAIEWLLMLWQATQTFDDVADGDPVSREELNATIWNTLVAMNRNEFWLLHQSTLTPIVASMILKWQASDRAERAGNADAKSFVWRAGYYDVVLMVIQLLHGAEVAINVSDKVMALYGERYEDYLKEFEHG